MNNTLSAFIAFAGFMVVFSVLVTSVQETFKNLLKLRTGVWESFFHALYKKEFGAGKTADNKPVLIPNYWSRPFIGGFKERMKRLKRLIIQADTSFRELMKEVDNINLEDLNLKKIEELLKAVQHVKILNLDHHLNIFDKFSKSDFVKFKQAVIILESLLHGYLKEQKDDLKKNLNNCLEDLKTQIDNIIPEITEYRLKLELKADAWLEQVNHNYKRNMHKWTFFIGLTFVFICNADAFSIYRHLRVNPELRASIIELADKTDKTELKFKVEQLNSLKSDIAREKEKTPRDYGKLKRIANTFSKDVENLIEDYKQFNLPVIPLNDLLKGFKSKIKDMEEKYSATDKQCSGNKKAEPATFDDYSDTLESYYSELAVLFVSFQKKTVDQQLKRVTDTELPLGWSNDFKDYKIIGWSSTLLGFLVPKLGGLLLTSVLITFGAPFWRDVLKAMIGLKNAGKVDLSKV